jgi:hypothetical protein
MKIDAPISKEPAMPVRSLACSEVFWTREKPTRPGFYWVRNDTGAKTIPEVKQFAVEGEYAITPGAIEPVYGPFSTDGWDWFAGPLYPPNDQGQTRREGRP